MSEIEKVFNNEDFCDKLIHIAKDLNAEYGEGFPFNLGYYHEAKKTWSWDCWNLVKSLIWGWEEKRVNKYYCYDPGKYGLGDWGGVTILSYCTDVSTDFKKLTKGEYLLFKDGSHAGMYIGNYEHDGKIYNVVEATTDFDDGVIFSYVSEDGGRYSHKNGKQTSKKTPWAKHGKLPWIDYIEEEESEEEKRKEMEKELALVKEEHWNKYLVLADEIMKGKWGNNPQRKRSLNSCGYDYRFAQDIVNTICKWSK